MFVKIALFPVAQNGASLGNPKMVPRFMIFKQKIVW
jgi:hypothetical protein